ncbi:hypothetical protein LJC29_06345 [Bacteroides sp. OttesenSCG-928-N06]|nr:hypothetical protein [Bacteroides sp. OttesenSCG-928-N06]
MLQRDLIMRVIQLFFEALARFLRNKEGKSPDILRRELDDLYKSFLKHPRGHFNDMSVEDILKSFIEEERIAKGEIVAELIFQDALVENADRQLLVKALALFKQVDLMSETFSFDRQRKMMEIESLIKA